MANSLVFFGTQSLIAKQLKYYLKCTLAKTEYFWTIATLG